LTGLEEYLVDPLQEITAALSAGSDPFHGTIDFGERAFRDRYDRHDRTNAPPHRISGDIMHSAAF